MSASTSATVIDKAAVPPLDWRFYGWRNVLAAFVGLALCPGPVAFYSLGVFFPVLAEQFSSDISDVALIATILTVGIAIGTPLIGALVDRFGAKSILIGSFVLFACGLAMAAYVSSLFQLYLTYAFIGVGSAGANSLPFMRLLSAWFDRRRGLAIGVSSAGMGLGFTLVPWITQASIDAIGWRGAYLVLAALVLVIGTGVIAIFVKNDPAQLGLHPDGASHPRGNSAGGAGPLGDSLAEALRRRQYWLLMPIFFLVTGSIYGISVHLVSIVSHGAGSTELAVQCATVFGAAMLLGRIGTGLLFDRLFAPLVLGILLVVAIGGLMFGLTSGDWRAVLMGSFLVGLASGAESDALAYLIGRYFGLRVFGTIFSHIFCAAIVGISLFPYLIGLVFDRTGSYDAALHWSAASLAAGALLLGLLGRFPALAAK